MSFITGKQLPRRTFLRGAGATVALPFLEAMACGLPVVTTEVGGNAEVVCDESLGSITPFGDADALKSAIADALARDWDRERIIEYARENSWDTRVEILEQEFVVLARA
mgnify:CR=1 FL=1